MHLIFLFTKQQLCVQVKLHILRTLKGIVEGTYYIAEMKVL